MGGGQSGGNALVVETPQLAEGNPLLIGTPQVQPDPQTPTITTNTVNGRPVVVKQENASPDRSTGPAEETPADQAPQGNAPVTSKFVDAHKIAATLSRHNIKDIDPSLLKIKDAQENKGGGSLKLTLDNGHELEMNTDPNKAPAIKWKQNELNRHDAAAIVALGKSAGWGDVVINCSDRDKTMLCMEAAKQGVKVGNPPPPEVFEKYKKEIEAAERAPGQTAAATATAPAVTATGGTSGGPVRQAARPGGMKM